MSVNAYRIGPDSSRLIRWFEEQIHCGGLPVGQYVPSTRELGKRHGVSYDTVRRALKLLETRGVVAAAPRHGFQVLRKPARRGEPVYVCVLSRWDPENRDDFETRLLNLLQHAAIRSGASVVGVRESPTNGLGIVEQVQRLGAAGVILDTPNPHVLAAVTRLGIPTVLAEQSPIQGFDTISQDNFGGSRLAALHLIERGHKRIAWASSHETTGVWSPQRIERWGGFASGLREHGLHPAAELAVSSSFHEADRKRLAALFRRPNRPTAVVAPWGDLAVVVADAIVRAGLEPGRDVELVGWNTEEGYGTYSDQFSGRDVPATVLWRITTMAATVVARLAERCAKPDLPPVHQVVETALRPARQAPATAD